jgi:hypothetical protein
MLSIIALVGAVLLAVTLLGGVLLSPAFFVGLQPIWHGLQTAYGWLASALSAALTFLLYPFFWVFNLWFASHPPNLPTLKTLPNARQQSVARMTIPPAFTNALTILVRLLLPLVLLLIALLLVRMIMRRRRRIRTRRQSKSSELHESVWSWELFWQQLRAFWLALFGRRGQTSEGTAEQQNVEAEDRQMPAAARNIRELYRALLRRASELGYRRGRTETPREFQHRLDEQLLTSEPQLESLTGAYVLVRYGGHEPAADELQRARQDWFELEQKWQVP